MIILSEDIVTPENYDPRHIPLDQLNNVKRLLQMQKDSRLWDQPGANLISNNENNPYHNDFFGNNGTTNHLELARRNFKTVSNAYDPNYTNPNLSPEDIETLKNNYKTIYNDGQSYRLHGNGFIGDINDIFATTSNRIFGTKFKTTDEHLNDQGLPQLTNPMDMAKQNPNDVTTYVGANYLPFGTLGVNLVKGAFNPVKNFAMGVGSKIAGDGAVNVYSSVMNPSNAYAANINNNNNNNNNNNVNSAAINNTTNNNPNSLVNSYQTYVNTDKTHPDLKPLNVLSGNNLINTTNPVNYLDMNQNSVQNNNS